jgi:hypothetical protein
MLKVSKESILIGIKKIFPVENIIIFILAFFVSNIPGIGYEEVKMIFPYTIGVLAASISAEIPFIVIAIIGLIGTIVNLGGAYVGIYLLVVIILLLSILIKRPHEDLESNETRKVGKHVSYTYFIILALGSLFGGRFSQDILFIIANTLLVFLSYKLFSNGISVIKNFAYKYVFSLEEVFGTFLFLLVALSPVYDFQIFSFNIYIVVLLFFTIWLAWREGIIVGVFSGIAFSLLINVLNKNAMNSELILFAVIASIVSGLISKTKEYSKIIVGLLIVLSNFILIMFFRGNPIFIRVEEVLIAFLAILFIPDKAYINIEDFFDKKGSILQYATTKTLKENKDEVKKEEKAKKEEEKSEEQISLKEIFENDAIKEDKDKIYTVYKKELNKKLDKAKDNILSDEIKENEDILKDIYEIVYQNEVIRKNEIVEIFEKNNNFMVSNNQNINDLEEMIKIINSSYRKTKVNYKLYVMNQDNNKEKDKKAEEIETKVEIEEEPKVQEKKIQVTRTKKKK